MVCPRAELLHSRDAHVGELALQVIDDPRHRQWIGVTREARLQAGTDQLKEPAGFELGPRHTLDVPGSTPTLVEGQLVRAFQSERRAAWCSRRGEADAHLSKRTLEALHAVFWRDQRSQPSVGGR